MNTYSCFKGDVKKCEVQANNATEAREKFIEKFGEGRDMWTMQTNILPKPLSELAE